MLLKSIAVILVLFICQRVWHLSVRFDPSYVGFVHRPGPCRNVLPVETGSEDIVLTSDGLAFISSGLRLTDMCFSSFDPKYSEFIGRIYRFDVEKSDGNAVEVKLPKELEEEFAPHGMDVWEDPATGDIYLFVVNHRRSGDHVEIFKYDRELNSLVLKRSVADKLFTSLNDVLAVGADSFYAANDGYSRSCWRAVEFLVGLSWCTVVYFDGDSVQSVINGGNDFNSLGKSHNGKYVYLTLPSHKQVNIYNRTGADGTLVLHRSINIGVVIDNIFIDEDEELWFGTHPSLLLLNKYFSDLSAKCPSQVTRVMPLGPDDDPFASYKLFAPFGDDGELVSASSSAVHYKNKLLIGTISHKLAICELLY